jgi:mannosyl-glycoprotein endo-beta-N-acetylglucosaminidase
MSASRLLGVATLIGVGLLILSLVPPAPLVQVTRYTRGLDAFSPFGATVALAAEPGARLVAVSAGLPAPIERLTPRPATELDRTGMDVVRSPSIDKATIRRVLQTYGSPAVGEAEAFYDLGERYGLDPAVCLAFFVVESSAGTKGMATETRSVGNIRATPGYVNYRGYRKYPSWRDGVEDWYRLIAHLYVGLWGLGTVETIVPTYAPAADNNDPARYVSTVRRLVTDWRAGRV